MQQLRDLLNDRAVPPVELEKLRTRILIVNLMDQLYAIEESLFTHHRPHIREETDGWNAQSPVYARLSRYER